MRWLKRLWPKRLAGQMIALLLLALVLAQVASILIFADERRLAIRAADRSQLLGRVVSVVRLLESSPGSLHDQILKTASGPRIQFWLSETSAVDFEDDHRHRDRFVGRRLAELLGERADRDVRIDINDDDNDDWRSWRRNGERRAWKGEHHHRLEVVISMQLRDGRWLNLESRLSPHGFGWTLPVLTWFGLMAIALALVVILMIRRITKPMAALATAAERVGRGEDIEPLSEVGPIDVRQTTTAFNRMHERLKRFVKDRTQMLAAMSHDLRTPITTLRLRAEFIDDEETRSKILETLEEMQRMTEATLAFVREEASVEPTRLVDLSALIESVAADLADIGHDVIFEPSDRLNYACRSVGMKRALRNLMENAIRYGDRAEVRLDSNEQGVTITIDDQGPGIPEDEIERMFRPFVRLEASRSEETGGIGLGLAIARSIIRGHGGDIQLTNREGQGLRATVTLPKAATKQTG